MNKTLMSQISHRLIRLGVVLFLFGLITGFLIPVFNNPRMGLSSHLEAILNGMFLILIGLIWEKLILSEKMAQSGFYLAVGGTFLNWMITLLAAIWGAGSEMMPIAGGQSVGTAPQELIIKSGLIILSISMVAVCIIILWGLRHNNLRLRN